MTAGPRPRTASSTSAVRRATRSTWFDLDANEQVPGNEAFQFIDQAQFTAPGQLRFFHRNGDTVVQADMSNATAGAELEIVLNGLVTLQATDFVL